MTDTINNRNETILSDFCPKKTFSTHPDNPLSKSEFNWIFKQREFNGFKASFVKVTARNYLVHIPTFVQCLADRRGA
ncbi:hypothetical protein [Methylobacter tundripaludum]|uniref:hypothetical protein n=1 Tax=Methylobacter tundripaludum TaxID=173365 RepID=UPI0004818BFC|nr:hypothetical protein [Methylobacter tundripaludum]